MYSELLLAALGLVYPAVLLTLLFVLFMVVVALVTEHPMAIKIALTVEKVIMGLLGMFKCQNSQSYCVMGMELTKCWEVAVFANVGIYILAVQLSIIMLLTTAGVGSLAVLIPTFLSYFAYPLAMYGLRKKCS